MKGISKKVVRDDLRKDWTKTWKRGGNEYCKYSEEAHSGQIGETLTPKAPQRKAPGHSRAARRLVWPNKQAKRPGVGNKVRASKQAGQICGILKATLSFWSWDPYQCFLL